MSELASFLPRHFAATAQPASSRTQPTAPPSSAATDSAANSSSAFAILSHPTHPSSAMRAHHLRRGSMSGFSSTASESSIDSPMAGLSSASSTGSQSPSPPSHQERLFFPPAALSECNKSMAALLPSAPNLKRQQSQPPLNNEAGQCATAPSTGQAPAGSGGKMLWINTDRPAAPKQATSSSASLPFLPSFTPPSSPVGSASPMTGTDLPAVHAMRISVSPAAADYCSPASSPLSASFTATPSIPQPRSPVAHSRHVPLVTPPSSPVPARQQALPPLPQSAHAAAADEPLSAAESPFPSPPSACLSLDASLALSFCPESSLPELLASISMVIHVQLIKDEQASDEAKNRLPAFRELPSTTSPLTPTVCPSVRSIYQFLLHVFQRGRFQSELALLSLVYVHRAMASSRVALTPVNFRPLFISALCLANKMWDDTPLINADFRILYPQLLGCTSAHSLSKPQYLAAFNKLETQLCAAIDWNLAVSTDTFHLYLHELQAIWTEYEHGLHSQQALSAPAAHGQQQQQQQQPPSALKQEAIKGAAKAALHSHRHHPYAGSKRRDRSIPASDGDGEGHCYAEAQSAPMYNTAYQPAALLQHVPMQQAVL